MEILDEWNDAHFLGHGSRASVTAQWTQNSIRWLVRSADLIRTLEQ
jgi:hypothetical protein